MKLLIGKVEDNKDPESKKRIQASIPGLTEGVSLAGLPWAFPLDDQCVIPEIGDEVKLFVDQEDYESDFDYNRLWYQRWTSATYKECTDLSSSDSYKARGNIKLDDEPSDPSSTTYPENRVVKLSKITVEFDSTNKRFCVTDESGNYLRMNADGSSIKSVKELFLGALDTMLLQANKEIVINSATDAITIQAQTKVEIGSGLGTLEKMVLGEQLSNFLTQIVNWANNHIHTTSMGPTILPNVPILGPVPPTILSANNKNN